MSRLFQPPWREKQPDGHLGREYGPRTQSTYAKHLADFSNWAYSPPRKRQNHVELLQSFMRSNPDVPDSEVQAYHDVFVTEMSVRKAAAHRSISRSSVRSYLRRLMQRAMDWLRGLDERQRRRFGLLPTVCDDQSPTTDSVSALDNEGDLPAE